SLHAIVPDSVDLEQDETYLLPDNDLLWQSGIPTLAVMHHFFEYQPHLNLKLSHAQLGQAWVSYAKKIKKFIERTVKPGLSNILRNNKIDSPFEVSEMCLIWDYVIHHHRVSLMTEHLGLLDQMDWASLTDRYVFIMQIITIGEAFKGMPNSLYLHIMKVLTKILKLSESDANQRIKLIMTLRDQFAHRENPAFHNQWCDLFHGNPLSRTNKHQCLISLEVLQTIYDNQHLLINHDLDIHYQDALLDSLEQSENNVSPRSSQRQPEWIKQLISFGQAPNNKTGKKVTTLVTHEPVPYNETAFASYESLDGNIAAPVTTDVEPTELRRRITTVHVDTLKPIIVSAPAPQLHHSFTTTTLDETHLLQNRIDLYKELYKFHKKTRRKRIKAFKNPTPSLGLASGLLKLIEAEKLLVILSGSLLRPLIREITELENLDKAKQTIKIRHGLAHKASLFKYDGNDIDVLGRVLLPKLS
ncbi:MAG: hypothetical protein P8L77_01895, partial [Gammaproteobacteria bacterium]|nr:hypothetical protein [Gammaproteobacteria bacterium]